MKVIATEHAPAAIGPYSQGYITGNLVFTSGQIPIAGSKSRRIRAAEMSLQF